MIQKFRSKVVTIEAVQLKWVNWAYVCEMLGDIISEKNPGRNTVLFSDACGEASPYIELDIPTLEGIHLARHGDWIIKGLHGEFYPCKPEIFKLKYEAI